MPTRPLAAKRRIIVLGGGIAALSSVFALTNVPNWQEYYDITLYQIGWRLGGKCASGRNAKKNFRLEEHGLHVWGGFYENAFWMVKKCYQELNRPADAPLSTWQQAFVGQNVFYLKEDDWHFWSFCLPNCDAYEPGFDENDSPEGLRDMIAQTVGSFQAWFEDFLQPDSETMSESVQATDAKRRLNRAIHTNERLSVSLFQTIINLLQSLILQGTNTSSDLVAHLLRQLRRFAKRKILSDARNDARYNQHRWVIYDLLLTSFIGIFADHLLTRSIDDTIGDLEYGVWLKKHGLSEATWLSPLIHAMYDIVFSFPDGEFGAEKRNVNAASMLKITLQILRYRGAPIYRMMAGMGDTVISPLYQVLKARGVKFEFFHNITNLGLSEDGTRLEQVEMCRQVTLKSDYDPLITVGGLPCWPSEPRYEQIVDGDQLERLIEQGYVNLETPNSSWEHERPLTLHLHKDFDEVIFGISLGAIPYVCGELLAADSKWQRMTEAVKTLPTQSLQLWLRPRLPQFNWMKVPDDAFTKVKRTWLLRLVGCQPDTETASAERFLNQPPMVGGIYTAPHETMDTWVAMDHLIEIENYSHGTVGTVAYFTGLVKQSPENLEITPDSRAAALDVVTQNAQHLLDTITPRLWTMENRPVALGGEDQALIVDSYIRSNTVPSDLYVLSVAGSLKYRLSCQERHFCNLWLVGDWTRCGLDLGYVEAAVTSGLLGARALLKDLCVPGYAPRVVGGDDYYWLDNRREDDAVSARP